MLDFISNLGIVYEGSFKLGFLEEVDSGLLESFRRLFYARDEVVKLRLKEVLEGLGSEESDEWRKYIKSAYFIGYESGRFYGKQVGKNALLEKHWIGEGSFDVHWKNADLVYIKDGVLHVVDFKLGGFLFSIIQIFKGGYRIPIRIPGTPINISVGMLELKDFVDSLLKHEENLISLSYGAPEVTGMVQLLCYAVDYILDENNQEQVSKLKSVVLELIYPLAESFRAEFSLGKKPTQEQAERLKQLYRKLKEKGWLFDNLVDAKEIRGRQERVKRQTEEEIGRLFKEIIARRREVKRIEADSIVESRQDVRKRLEEFMTDKRPVKVIVLLHSAGSGKTSNIRELILNSEGNHIVFYFSSRLRIVEREYNKLKALEKEGIVPIWIREKRVVQKGQVKNVGRNNFEADEKAMGYIRSSLEEVQKHMKTARQIWVFLTQQSVLETFMGKSTADWFLKMEFPRSSFKNFHFHFIFDEIFGSPNGLYAVSKFFEVLKMLLIQLEGKFRANLYILDANGYSPELFWKLLIEYSKFEVIPASIVISYLTKEHIEEGVERKKGGIPLKIYTRHGYPSKEVFIHRRFFLKHRGEEHFVNALGKFIVNELKKFNGQSSAFLFLQNRKRIIELSEYLKKHNVSTLIATSNSKKSQEEINNGYQDVILGTSAVSRGLDFSRPHKPVDIIFAVIQNFDIEENLVELLQALSRARGDKITEDRPKHIYLIYHVPEESEEVIDYLGAILHQEDKELIKLIRMKEKLHEILILDDVVVRIVEQFIKTKEGVVFVPIPAQYTTFYRENPIAELEDLVSFLNDVYLMEGGKPEILELIHLLISAIYIYTRTSPDTDQKLKYYHPYILINGKVEIKFDNEKREVLLRKFYALKSLLEKHNKDKTDKLENFIRGAWSVAIKKLPLLMPIYSYALVKHLLKDGQVISFNISRRVGRGGAEVLGGRLNLTTRCYKGKLPEYGIIPLGEDYPYVEVLSGRFAKFPIEFFIFDKGR